MTDTQTVETLPEPISRGNLSTAGITAAKAKGLLHVDSTATAAFPLSAEDRAAAVALTAKTLTDAGVKATDRVVVSLNNDGELGGTLVAEAAAEVAAAAASTGPRGRMRLLRTVENMRANVLVGTATGVSDFLARLHLEFLVEPLDLELRLIVLTGEIADPKKIEHLGREFGAHTVELFTDPLSGIPLAHKNQNATALTPTHEGLLELATPAETSANGELAEIVVRYPWHSSLAHIGVRTGYLSSRDGESLTMPTHTYGDLLLIRGRWISFSALTKALRGIDGIAHWELRVARQGTLDSATVFVSFNRESLVKNGMWHARIEQAISAMTPISVQVEIDPHVREDSAPPSIRDERGHHL
ncbi:hypothetical protein R4282_32055 [Rhodococcus oxybenzonivorans]|uniref:hypothetical protein n=1 Tax=Rhodococcus oxybenzonivorans TaxID=1990687 RepID=UPI0029556AA6|nr:hypothetical protein [Rhodococcus oxybenzonivorans]MDV7357628.1 hypothetical protein [Rhodococcus oxybenzonivorans]